MKLQEYLKEMRLKTGMSQWEVADKLGYSSPQFVSNWERGLSVPPIKTLKAIAIVYGCDAKILKDFILEHELDKKRKDIETKFSKWHMVLPEDGAK